MKTHNSHNLITWGGFAIVTFLIYMLSSSGDFSFILTLAAGIQSFGFGQVIFTLKKTKDVGGVSWNTFSSCGLALLGRLLSVLLYEGYLPVDASGDYVYRGFESLSFIFCVLTLLELKSSPVTMRQDSIDRLRWYYFAPPAFVLAILIHPDIFWTFGLYLESVALMPQILLFTKRGLIKNRGEIELHTQNFVASQALSRILTFIFWCYSFTELNEATNEFTLSIAPGLSGYFAMGAQIIQILLMADFLYLYLKSWRTGIPLVMLP